MNKIWITDRIAAYMLFSAKRGLKSLSLQSQVAVGCRWSLTLFIQFSSLPLLILFILFAVRSVAENSIYCAFIWFYSLYATEKSFSLSNVIHIHIRRISIWLADMLWLDAVKFIWSRLDAIDFTDCVFVCVCVSILNRERNSEQMREWTRIDWVHCSLC